MSGSCDSFQISSASDPGAIESSRWSFWAVAGSNRAQSGTMYSVMFPPKSPHAPAPTVCLTLSSFCVTLNHTESWSLCSVLSFSREESLRDSELVSYQADVVVEEELCGMRRFHSPAVYAARAAGGTVQRRRVTLAAPILARGERDEEAARCMQQPWPAQGHHWLLISCNPTAGNDEMSCDIMVRKHRRTELLSSFGLARTPSGAELIELLRPNIPRGPHTRKT
jgi:hypothetical protein